MSDKHTASETSGLTSSRTGDNVSDENIDEHLAIFHGKVYDVHRLEALKEQSKHVAQLKIDIARLEAENERAVQIIEQLSEEITKLRTTLNIEQSFNH